MATKTPLYDALNKRAKEESLRFHMPGHKGRALLGRHLADAARLDFTELEGTGDLYRGEGHPIRQAEGLWAEALGAGCALFCTGGATQGIMAMLATYCHPGDRILIDQNAHMSLFSACALLDLHPYRIGCGTVYPFGVPAPPTARDLDQAFERHPRARVVVVTTPTYHGVLARLDELSAAAKRRGALLLVDAAHGAHLPFLGGQNPLASGAAGCVLSAHKTLGALGQSAVLLASDPAAGERLRQMTALFGTSSPSYVLMASLDLARADMEDRGAERLQDAINFAARLREELMAQSLLRPLTGQDAAACGGAGIDPARLTLYAGELGMTGFALGSLLAERGIICEMCDRYSAVLILTGHDSPEDLAALSDALGSLTPSEIPSALGPIGAIPPADRILTPREAFSESGITLPLRQCGGLIALRPVVPYPPGVPIIAPGERIEKKHLSYLAQIEYNMDEPISVLPLP